MSTGANTNPASPDTAGAADRGRSFAADGDGWFVAADTATPPTRTDWAGLRAGDGSSTLTGEMDDAAAASLAGAPTRPSNWASLSLSAGAGAGPVVPASASLRIFRIFVGSRAALGVAVAFGQLVTGALGAWAPPAVLAIVFFYAFAAVVVWLRSPQADVRDPASPWGLRRRNWAATIGFDIACFGGLHALSPLSGPNHGALLVLPVLMAGIFMSRPASLAVSASVSGLLLAVAAGTMAATADVTATLTQAGLAAFGLFLVALLAAELAARLRREEEAARGSLERARQEAQLNRLVIDEMRDGVMVLDREGWVRRANPAARALIAATGGGPQPPFQLRGMPAWSEFVGMIESAFAAGSVTDLSRDVVLTFEPGYRRTLRVRPRFTRRRDALASEEEELCVLFLEDMRDVQARTRQEKLAAMGRVSAGIAHEIRNPLAAIAQANALMLEDAQDVGQQRLARMVADNVERLKRIVDDVMEVAPGPAGEVMPIDAKSLTGGVCADWARTNRVPIGPGAVLQVELPHQPMGVLFDADHLRRVLVNLLDNAYRHATRQAGSVRVRLYEKGAADAALLVVNDGDTIEPDVERHLFEPFFSTRSRGTGLGLYICRELCSRYGARIDYRQRPGHEGSRNEFHVVMRRSELPRPSATMTESPSARTS
jgi:two-component system, NtrC family, sensor histidine kinase PilS